MKKYLIHQKREYSWVLLKSNHWFVIICKYIFFGIPTLLLIAYVTNCLFILSPAYIRISVIFLSAIALFLICFKLKIGAINLHQAIIYEEINISDDLDALLEEKFNLESADRFKPRLFT